MIDHGCSSIFLACQVAQEPTNLVYNFFVLIFKDRENSIKDIVADKNSGEILLLSEYVGNDFDSETLSLLVFTPKGTEYLVQNFLIADYKLVDLVLFDVGHLVDGVENNHEIFM